MSRIVFATGNADKMVEIREILKDLGMEILSMKEAGVNPEIVEDGSTFEENALIKARAVHVLLPDDIVMADDSGLEIDYLNKEPGIYSARRKENRTVCLCHRRSLSRWRGEDGTGYHRGQSRL